MRKKGRRVDSSTISIPRDFARLHKQATLVADVFFVNEIPFLMAVSLRIDCITVQKLDSRKSEDLAQVLKKTCNIYGRAGFSVDVLLLDPEFESMEKELPNVFCNFAGAREHVPVIERKIHTVKERGRGIINVLPFATVPSRVIIELIHHVILWLNCVPSKVGISTIYIFSKKNHDWNDVGF